MAFKHNRTRWDDDLLRMDPTAFEALLAEHFRSKGYRVDHVGAAASGRRYDGGIDLRLYRGDERILVQCKRWNAYQVPHNDVHELLGIMLTEQATGAILVSSGEFTPAARAAAARSDKVQLIDGTGLRAVLDLDSAPAELKAWRKPSASGVSGARRAPGPSRLPAWVAVLKSVVALVVLLITVGACVAVYTSWRMPSPLRTTAATAVQPVSTTPASQFRASPPRSDLPFAVADQLQGVVSAAMIAPDPNRRIDPEAARAAARTVNGVRSAVWLDGTHLIVRVDSTARRSMAMIDEVCHVLEPLGDTLGVVIALQNAAATNGDEMESLLRNCRLPEGRRALLQARRQIDTVSPELRAQFKAMQDRAVQPASQP